MLDLVKVGEGDSATYKDVFEFTVHGDAATLVSYNGSETDVTIPAKYKGNTVTTIGNNAFKDNTTVASVVIPDGVTKIGNATFSGCTALADINFPDSLDVIDQNAFNGCTALKSISLNNGLEEVLYGAFNGCTALDGELTISDTVTEIGVSAFEGCSSVDGKVTIPDSVTKLGNNAFRNCTSITDAVIGAGITTIPEQCFRGSGLTSITIPETVTLVDNMAFWGCASLTGTLHIHSGLTVDNAAFYNSGLTGVTFGDGSITLSDSSFRGTSISSLTIPSNVSLGTGVFDNCRDLRSVTIGEGITAIPSKTFWGVGGTDGEPLVVELPRSLETIGVGAFYNCKGTISSYEDIQYMIDDVSSEALVSGEKKTVAGGTFDVNLSIDPSKYHTVTYQYSVAPTGVPSLHVMSTVKGGSEVPLANVPELTGYTCAWSGMPSVTDGKFIMPASDVVIVGTWTLNTHTVTFMDGETVLGTNTLGYGSAVTSIADPVKTGYTFASWTPALPESMPDEDVTVSATWTLVADPVSIVIPATNAPAAVNAPAVPGNSPTMVSIEVPGAQEQQPASPAPVTPSTPILEDDYVEDTTASAIGDFDAGGISKVLILMLFVLGGLYVVKRELA